MPMQLKAVFDGVSERKLADGRKVFKGVASSLTLDRHGEVVVPKGMNITDFETNPVLMSQHDYRSAPIGTIVSIKPDSEFKTVPFEFVFDESDPEAVKLMKKVENGTMRTFSIGFLPTKWVEQEELVDDTGKMKDAITVQTGETDDDKYLLDLTQYKKVPRRVYTQWDLLEVSLVSIPANPSAHMTLMAKDLVDEALDLHPEAKGFIEEEINDRVAQLKEVLDSIEKDILEYEMNGAVGVHHTPIVEGSWDGDSARAHLAKWASSDGSGDKEKMAWGKYARGFGWFDSSKTDSFGSYKLPHHDIRGGSFVGVRSGITAAMAANLGARGGTNVGGDGEAVHRHLSAHYRDMDMEPPEFHKSYTEEELTKIADGTWTKPVEPEGTAASDGVALPDPNPPSTYGAQLEALAASINAFREILETKAIGLNIKLETILEGISDVARTLAIRHAEPKAEPTAADDAGKAADQAAPVLAQLKDALAYLNGGAGDGNSPAN